jgi:mannose-1-phosphate guanylyltransferase
MKNNYVVIMAGGVGTRFWPLSRANFPKQFHDILGTGKTMIQQATDRFDGVCPKENIYVVTNALYKDLVKQNLPYLNDNQILLEPEAKNTAPCIAYAVYKIKSINPDANIVISPSDQFILKENEYAKTIKQALDYAGRYNDIITIGIVPTRPDTGYGYIQYDENDQNDVKKVIRFAEKPNHETALQFLASGDFLWNGGIFVFNVNTIIDAFKEYLPDIDQTFSAIDSFYFTSSEQEKINQIYPLCQSISIDYGIMEKATNVRVILGYFGWSDVGTWKSVYELAEKNTDNNVVEGNTMLFNTKNCIVKMPKNKLTVINGLDGFIVAEFENVLMICQKDDEQKVKEFVTEAKKKFGAQFI